MPTSVCFLVGNQSHFADELVELAVQRITKTEGKPIYPGARADVTFHVDDKEILAEVIVGQIMKPCWIVRFGKNLKVLSYKKSFGRG